MRQDSIKMTIGGISMVGTSMGSSFISDPQNLFSVYAYSIQVVWSGGSSPSGTFTLQGSNDPGNSNLILQDSPPVNWTTISNSGIVVTGTPGDILYDVTECSYRWVRLVYTYMSGSATISDAQINIKGV